MKRSVDSPPLTRVLDTLLSLSMVGGVVLAGSWIWPGLHLQAVLGVLIALVIMRTRHSLGVFELGLAGMSLVSLAQALPLPSPEFLSEHARGIRDSAQTRLVVSVAYERQAAFREALKYALYFLTALAVRRHVLRAGIGTVSRRILWTTGASVLFAIAHRALGLTELFGVLAWRQGPEWPSTTFVNPNHAATLFGVACLTSLAARTRDRRPRFRGFFAAIATMAGVACVLQGSHAATFLLGLFLVVGAVLGAAKRRPSMGPLGLVTIGAVALLLGLTWSIPALDLALAPKLAGIEDAGQMISDHALFGVGRGSFVTVYPHYESGPLNLIFTFPENIVVQYISEWGVPLGFAGLVVVSWPIVAPTSVKARDLRWIRMAAAFVLAHELADFGMELPGIMLIFVSLCACLRSRTSGFRPSSRVFGWSLALAIISSIATTSYLGFRGDLFRDQRRLDELMAAPQLGEVDVTEAGRRARRHFANGLVSSKYAYILERTATEPTDLREALRIANLAMLTNQSYPDAHLIAGRLLLRLGHRSQGLGQFREAWELAWDGRRIAEQAEPYLRGAGDLEALLPRLDDGITTRPGAALWAAEWLREHEDAETASKRMATLMPSPELLADLAVLPPLGREARRLALLDLELGYLRRWAELDPTSPEPYLALLRAHVRRDEIEAAEDVLATMRSKAPDPDALALAEFALLPTSTTTLAIPQLRRLWASTSGDLRISLIRKAARLLLDRSQPVDAEQIASEGLLLRPDLMDLRMVRARALEQLGRMAEARRDLQHILRREPEHSQASTLLERWSQ